MERPILMSAPNVRAILEGRKTQTRRVVKPQPDFICSDGTPSRHTNQDRVRGRLGMAIPCPYGIVGDRLWVREAWRTDKEYDPYSPAQIDSGASLFYLADSNAHRVNRRPEYGPHEWGRYRHARFMPRWASRINLEITAIRVERTQDISYHDCLAEGIAEVTFRPGDGYPLSLGYMIGPDDGKTTLKVTPQEPYRELWEQINGPGSWELNPWVWVVEFKRVA